MYVWVSSPFTGISSTTSDALCTSTWRLKGRDEVEKEVGGADIGEEATGNAAEWKGVWREDDDEEVTVVMVLVGIDAEGRGDDDEAEEEEEEEEGVCEGASR